VSKGTRCQVCESGVRILGVGYIGETEIALKGSNRILGLLSQPHMEKDVPLKEFQERK